MRTPEEPFLTQRAVEHARRIQLGLVAAIIAIVSAAQLLAPWIEAATDALGLPTEAIGSVILVFVGAIISIFASWSSVWIVFGSGRWTSRLAFTLMLFHGAVVIWFGMASIIDAIRDTNSMDSGWRDALATLASLSYAFAGQILVSMFFVWLMKLFRFHLLYFNDANSYPHPRELGRRVPINERRDTFAVSGRVYLADIFALTTLVAAYLAAWYPIVEIGLQDDRMLGASFVFLVLLVMAAGNALAGLPLVLFPFLVTMLDRRGKTVQICFHSITYLMASVSVALSIWYGIAGSEGNVVLVAAMIALLAYQILLFTTMRKPSQWFRFRLIRLKVQ